MQKFTKIQKFVKKGHRWSKRRDNPRARKIKNELAKKAKKTRRDTKKNKWIEDEQTEGIQRQNRHSKK